MNNILIVNAGSSSLKYQLIDMTDEHTVAKGNVERIGIEGSKLTHKHPGGTFTVEQPLKDHTAAIRLVLEALTDKEHGVISSMDEISAVGHRVLHGGEKFAGSYLINDEVMAAIEENIPLGPLHNPANLMGIRACQEVMPNTPMVAVFDTAFHMTMPKEAYLYALPLDYYKRLKVRRYGFHGTSHRFVAQRTREILPPEETEKLIICHLGNGSSLSAVKDGKVVDTSMGLTPLEGVVMGTRCGSIDPAIIYYIMKQDKISIEEVDTLLNKKSGLLGLTGLSSDMRDVRSAAEAGNEDAITALKIWAYVIRKQIGAYAAAMDGVNTLVFTAGIGENDAQARTDICDGLSFLGIALDHEKNSAVRGVEACISTPDSRVKVMVVPTNEELVIARDTLALSGK